MKFKDYINEKMNKPEGFNFNTKKDQTGHSHMAEVDEHGNGTTKKTMGAKEHNHKVKEWNMQPAKGHMHTMGTK